MHAELTITQRDIEAFLQTMTPMKIILDEHRTLFLGRPRSVSIAPEHGVRLELSGRVRWTVIGIDVPVTLTSVSILAVPTIEERHGAGALVLRLEVEHADVKVVPDALDETLRDRVNAALRKDENALVWELTRTLDFHFALPSSIAPASTIRLCSFDARIRIEDARVVLSVDLHAAGSTAYQPASEIEANEGPCGH